MSPDTVISVRNLGKRYRLGSTFSPNTLRDHLAGMAGALWSRAGRPRRKKEPSGPREIWALRDVAFDVRQGEVLGIIGRNGSGKSTLLKILSEITDPTEGEARVRGRIGSLLEVGTGMHPELTGRENVYLNGAILGMGRAEIDRKYDQIVAFSGVQDFMNTPIKRYSSGMRVRLGFAIAAHLECEILVVDEVLAVGDEVFQRQCIGKMGDVARSGRTVLFVSHNMGAIRAFCRHGVLLEQGRVKQDGPAADVVEAYLRELDPSDAARLRAREGYLYSGELAGKEDCAVTGLQLLDPHGLAKARLHTWDSVRFRVHHGSRTHVAGVAVSLQIQTREGVPVMFCATQPQSGFPYALEAGDGWIDCVFERWPLSAGTYMVGAAIALPRVMFLWRQDSLCMLTVHERDVFHSGCPPSTGRGVVAAEHRWETGGARTGPSVVGDR